jgi:DNA-binding XRE family transcriptional regulator
MRTTKKRPTFAEFKKKALQNKDVSKEYETLKPIFDIKKQLISARIKKGLTQDEVAKRVGTSKSNISRLESLNNNYTPNLATLIKYAKALEMKLEVDLV